MHQSVSMMPVIAVEILVAARKESAMTVYKALTVLLLVLHLMVALKMLMLMS